MSTAIAPMGFGGEYFLIIVVLGMLVLAWPACHLPTHRASSYSIIHSLGGYWSILGWTLDKGGIDLCPCFISAAVIRCPDHQQLGAERVYTSSQSQGVPSITVGTARWQPATAHPQKHHTLRARGY